MNPFIEIAIIAVAVIALRLYKQSKRKHPQTKKASISPATVPPPSTLPAPPFDYQAAFNVTSGKTHVKSLGALRLPTGKIIACDGIVINDAKPFAVAIAPGDYEVAVLISNEGSVEKPNERIALAKLTFNDKPVAKWEMAVVHPTQPYGYGVDAGVGSFMDEQTHREYDAFERKLTAEDPDANIYDNFLEDIFKQNAEEGTDPYGQWANFIIPGTNNNVIMFSSGWGDGAYDSYWGYDAQGNVACLVTDFQILGDSEQAAQASDFSQTMVSVLDEYTDGTGFDNAGIGRLLEAYEALVVQTEKGEGLDENENYEEFDNDLIVRKLLEQIITDRRVTAFPELQTIRTKVHDFDVRLMRTSKGDHATKYLSKANVLISNLKGTNICPVCRYNGLSSPPYANINQFTYEQIEAAKPPYENVLGKPSYEVCPQCGFEFGNDDNPGTAEPISFAEYRAKLQAGISE